ncbi:MAG: FapA family protein [Candidatus Cloacimonetes bacterium]|jgi:uncharacterized protein (DUF342 family)|nr:FapA family protein [Candidatus Cloacimonadota bacterium]MDY0298662.1 FapA family protein [Candidatus Cloacimonadaceae bacterium]MCB5278489.1 FapA family protein [Candidatus Cloacimonadota bacterium]MCK9332760.1 FapA family protein [Candidatus Cloacimonadota bacterium]MDD2210629.1 FapA family protein [Candidatus Cloacimonadota bacterium]
MNKILTSKSGNLSLELRQDSASAWLTVKRSGCLVDEKEILDLIDEAGIKSGFDEAMQLIRERGIEKDFDKPFPIAVCKKGDQKEASLNYHFDPDSSLCAPSEINLEDLVHISYVNEGDVVATFSDNIFERDGSIYDIFGELITPPVINEEEALTLAGEGVRYEARDFVAETSGYPYLDQDKRICILTHLRVKAEEVPRHEFIRSPLELEIEGDISKVQIATARSLKVNGSLNECSVYIEGDLIVSNDIIGCTNPGIQVLGNMQVSSIKQSRVFVKEDIQFDNSIENSNVACDGNLIGTRSDSRITGGLSQAGGNIQIGIAGSESAEETEIEIAISPFYRGLLMQMTKEAVRMRDEGDNKALDELHERIKLCETELDRQLNNFLKRPADIKKSVRVEADVYPKTLFRILKHSYQIKTRQSGISIIEKD